jgi:hypothetical protein
MRNHVAIGPLRIRIGSRNLARWGYPRIQIGGLSLWSWTSSGHFVPISYHPRSSITWLWTVWVYRRERAFTSAGRADLARMYAEGNPFVAKPRWWHRFFIPDARKSGQRIHLLRLPFGAACVVTQERLPR